MDVATRYEETQRTEEHLPQHNGECQHENGQPVLDEHGGFHHHAYRYKENRTEKVTQRTDDLLDVLGFDGLRQDASHHEGTEGRAVADARSHYRQQETQADRHDEQSLVVDVAAGLPEQERHKVNADQEPKHQEETELHEAFHQFQPFEAAAHGHCAEHHHEQDAQYVLEDKYGDDARGKTFAAQSELVESFVDDGRRTHAEHTAQEDAVHAAPAEQESHHAANAYHAAHHHQRR